MLLDKLNIEIKNKNILGMALIWTTCLIAASIAGPFGFLHLCFAALAGYFNACMDTVSFHYHSSSFKLKNKESYYNPEFSWMNKYSNPLTCKRKKWFNLIPIPVMFTDFWHLMKSATLLFLGLCAVTYAPFLFVDNTLLNTILNLLTIRAVYGLYFTVFYDFLLRKPKDKKNGQGNAN